VNLFTFLSDTTVDDIVLSCLALAGIASGIVALILEARNKIEFVAPFVIAMFVFAALVIVYELFE
jgi:hypothetical protein